MQVKVKYLLTPTLIVVAIDQLTKSLAASKLDPDNPVSLVWTLQLNITRNPGASFSMGSNLTPYIASIAILAAMGITYLAWSETKARNLFCYGIVLLSLIHI